MVGDFHCDIECLNTECGYDGEDCVFMQCSAGCFPSMIGDGVCQEVCHVAACEWDKADCDCSLGCYPALQANSVCDVPCNSPECSFDNHKCVKYT